MRMRTWPWTLLAVMALSGCDGSESGGGGWPLTKVALATVQRSPAPRSVRGVGELEAVRQVVLSSETAGRVTRIAFASGQRVRQGELLVQLNDAPEQAERQRLRAQVRNAGSVLARTRQLQSGQLVARQQLDTAQADYDMANGELRRIEALIAQKAIRAPFAGVVGIRRVHPGQYLEAGDAIASLVDADTLQVNFTLDEQALPRLHPGLPVRIRVDVWPQRTFEARLNAVDPLVGTSRTVQVQARVDNPDGALRAGMFANVLVAPPEPAVVMAVPETAVTYAAYGQTVFVAREQSPQRLRVQRVAVRTGERWDGRVEILSGLEEGERVVVSGQLRLSDGLAVEAVALDALHEGTDAGAAAAPAP
ncbi:efflux RND transporter periplasmic adaptor subunit [Stenotrophomonas mori]|uniref:Efflux RND transporter periplasmic adaptor subunit n=1 Tax=Stenotrophomonas mori TaxID=2871096 RepID=A0ABT0SK43_9GAMM|nr:efflux RND transporter periplasmic adaptor subunit [Stenotrophomonas mori]MCL7715476.1 efflux RND transporter periplasmic adaptor subunit [Stenotrophomonas mori]